MISISIIYGTTGGNTQLVVEKIAEILTCDYDCKINLCNVGEVSYKECSEFIENSDYFMLAAPTYGHGEMQEDFIPFLKDLKKIDLKNKKCAIIGLGEAKYDNHYHIATVEILEKAVKKFGGEFIFRPLRISGNPVNNLDRLIPLWTKQFFETLS